MIFLRRQSGQGLTEAVLVIGAMGLLVCCLHRTATLRQLTLGALQESTLLVFMGEGRISTETHEERSMGNRKGVENELLGGLSGMLHRASSTKALGHLPLDTLLGKGRTLSEVHRASYTYLGTGQAQSSQSAHTNIANSKHFWGAVAGHSQRIATQTASRTIPIDVVWRRGKPKNNWLDGWSDVVPPASRQR
jgi:hypothetical protein